MAAALMPALAMGAFAPLQAQNAATPRPSGPVVQPPGYPYPVYVLPVQPRDERTPRQRCMDAEAARIGQALTELDRRTIDLKCSQR